MTERGIMPRAFIAVGSNLGDRLKNIQQAEQALKSMPGTKILRLSPVYETEPAGGPPQGKYLNMVWEIETILSPVQLLDVLLEIEKNLGRVRTVRNAPRTIDLDILLYDDKIIEREGLKVPHPRLHERTFVLKPLADLVPDWTHPQFGKTVRTLLEELLESHKKS
jgi:2-amino-4-hydroxy-6-hydroxymethyldihydropteridine diphosphokinase